MAKKEETKAQKFAAKDVFHATLGFYGKVYDEGSEKVKDLSEKREALIEDFVARGAELEAQAKEKIESFKNEDNKINERINSLRDSYNKLADVMSFKKNDNVEVAKKPANAKESKAAKAVKEAAA